MNCYNCVITCGEPVQGVGDRCVLEGLEGIVWRKVLETGGLPR